MSSFLQGHLADLYLVQAVALLVLGGLIALVPRHAVALPFGRHLWLVGVFAALHGVFKGIELRGSLASAAPGALSWLMAAWLLASFVPLFEFGRRLHVSRHCAENGALPDSRLRALLAWCVAGAIVVATAWVRPPSPEALAMGARAGLGFPGALLAGIGLLVIAWRLDRNARHEPIRLPLWIAGVGFTTYGLLMPLQYHGSPPLPLWLHALADFGAASDATLLGPRTLAALALTGGLAMTIHGSHAGLEQIKEQLRLSEQRLNEAQRIARVGSWVLDLPSNQLSWSDEIFRMFELDPGRFGATYEAFLAAIHPDDRYRVDAAYTMSLATRQPYEIEHRLRMVDGRIKHVIERCETEFDAQGRPLRSVGTVQDITERRNAEGEREEARNRLEGVLGSISDGFFTLDTNWIYTYVNDRAARLVGKAPQELLGRCIWDVFPAIEGSSWHQRYQQVMETQVPLKFLDRSDRLDAWFECSVYPYEDGISIFLNEVTERKRAADQIAAQLHEKEVLLREIHHRVKNNLQIVSSLLYLQQDRSIDSMSTEVLRECRNRVAAMALVHEKLYGSTDLSHVDFVDYARDLSNSLLVSFGAAPERIQLRVEGTHIVFPLDRAISCGLLLNEIVSNSLKHAFPDGRSGQIAVDVAEGREGYEVTIRDDGIGHGFTEQEQPSASLGLRLISRLVTQLGARIERLEGLGTGYRLMLPREECV